MTTTAPVLDDAGMPATLTKRKSFLRDGKKPTPEIAAQALRALAMNLRMGRAEDEALDLVGSEYSKWAIGRSFKKAAVSMRLGVSFVQALELEEELPDALLQMISAASTSRDLHRNIEEAATIISEGQNVRRQIKQALIAPGFMLAAGIAFMFIASIKIIPSFLSNFAVFGAEPPASLIFTQRAAEALGWISGAVLVLAILYGMFWIIVGRRSATVRRRVDALGLRAPLYGPIMKLASSSRLFELLSANLRVGLAEAEALEVAARGCGSEAIAAHCMDHAHRMRNEGVSLNEAMNSWLFPQGAGSLLGSVASTRQALEVLDDLAKNYRFEANYRAGSFAKQVEPIASGVVYSLVGILVVMVMLPMWSIYSSLIGFGNV